MQDDGKKREASLFRKIIIVISLPLVAFIWITGWTLTFIGKGLESRESVNKTLRIHPGLGSSVKSFESTGEDRKIIHESPIGA